MVLIFRRSAQQCMIAGKKCLSRVRSLRCSLEISKKFPNTTYMSLWCCKLILQAQLRESGIVPILVHFLIQCNVYGPRFLSVIIWCALIRVLLASEETFPLPIFREELEAHWPYQVKEGFVIKLF